MPALVHWRWRPCRLEASKSSSGGASASDDGALRAGLLIEYDKGGRGVLALVHSPDGKKNFWVVDQVREGGGGRGVQSLCTSARGGGWGKQAGGGEGGRSDPGGRGVEGRGWPGLRRGLQVLCDATAAAAGPPPPPDPDPRSFVRSWCCAERPALVHTAQAGHARAAGAGRGRWGGLLHGCRPAGLWRPGRKPGPVPPGDRVGDRG